MAGLDGSGVRVVVVGTGHHAPGSRLPEVPAVAATVQALGACFTDVCGVPADAVSTLVDPAGPEEFLDAVLDAASTAGDVLVLYYVGHGLLTATGALHLATRATVDVTRKAGFQALDYGEIVAALSTCRARQVLVVLDCCYSGRATVPVRSGALLASADRDEQALAPVGEEYTAFSGALLAGLRDGIATAPARITLEVLHDHLARVLAGQGRPAPVLQTGNAVRRLVLAPNAADRSTPPVDDTVPATEGECPYRGLQAYTAADSDVFHGRTQLVERVLARLGEQVRAGGITVVTGPSGSGKSSLLHAGVGPAIAHGDLGVLGSAGWPLVSVTPGADPLAAIADRIREVRGGGRMVVVVDQFEEIFDPDVPDADRAAVVHLLCDLARPSDEDPAALVVLGLRSDFTGHCAQFPELVAALETGSVLVGPMTSDELRTAVEEPARSAGLTLEPGLVELLLRDTGADALPLLSHALLSVWQRRSATTLTVNAYREIGGVAGAIAATAEQTYGNLPEAARVAARPMLLRLVRAGDGEPDTRRRAPRADLPEADEQALVAFIDARLVTADADTVTIAHEALLRSWPRLREWIDAAREDRLVAQEVEADAAAWDASGEDSSHLYRGGRLARAQARPLDLGTTPTRFLEVSVHAERRGARRTRQGLAVLATLLVLALVATVVAVVNGSEATEQRNRALVQALLARADQMKATDQSLAAQLSLAAYRLDPSGAARARITGTADTELSRELLPASGPVLRSKWPILASGGRDSTIVTAGVGSDLYVWNVADQAGSPGLARTEAPIEDVAVRPDGRMLAVTIPGRGVQLWAVRGEGVPIAAPAAPYLTVPGDLRTAAFLQGGSVLAVLTSPWDGSPGPAMLHLWQVDDPAHAVALPPVPLPGNAFGLAVASDRPLLAVMNGEPSVGGTVGLWDTSDPLRPVRVTDRIGHEQPVVSVAFGSENTLLIGTLLGVVELWSVAQPDQPHRIDDLTPISDPTERGPVRAVAARPGGTQISAAVGQGQVPMWDLAPDRYVMQPPVRALRGHSTATSSVTFVGHNQMVTAAADGSVRLWSLPSTGTLETVGAVEISAIAGPAGEQVLTTGSDTRVVDLRDPQRPRTLATLANSSVASSSGRIVALTDDGADQGIRLVDLSDPLHPAEIGRLPVSGRGDRGRTLALSPDGRLLIRAGGTDDPVQLWDVTDPTKPKRWDNSLAATAVTDVVFAPDSRTVAMTAGGDIRLWDVTDPARAAELATVGPAPIDHDVPGYPLAFSADGRHLAAIGRAGEIRLWNVMDPARPSLAGEIRDAKITYGSLAYSPDAGTVAAVTNDVNGAQLDLWDVSDPAHPERGTRMAARSLATNGAVTYDQDGRLIVGEIDIVTVFDTRFDVLVDRICTSTAGDLTPEQWNQYVGDELPQRPLCPH